MEILNFNFKEWKYSQDLGLKRVLIILFISGRKITTSLLDKCKRMAQLHPYSPIVLKIDIEWAEMI